LAGVAFGGGGWGDIILIPEIPYNEQVVFDRVCERSRVGKRFSLVVVAEGAAPRNAAQIYSGKMDPTGRKILGRIGGLVAERIEEATGLSARVTQLGHLQRGGSPTAFDRLLATQFGHAALDLVVRGEMGQMVAWKGDRIKTVALDKATRRIKKVPLDHPLIAAARSLGSVFGDEGGESQEKSAPGLEDAALSKNPNQQTNSHSFPERNSYHGLPRRN
jgi:6-phosphofructokinase 1